MRGLVLVLSLAAIALSVFMLERDRAGLLIAPLPGTGTTPATLYLTQDGGPAPVVIVAHGFAGSRQLMTPIALTLAHAGYTVVSYDLQGHGRNPVPMSGDVTSIDGTTRLLVNEARAVARAALAHPRADGRLAYLGHSMASDIVVRAALEDPAAQAVIGISMFSQAVSATAPANLLVVTGAWEGRLAAEALAALRLSDPAAELGSTTGDPATGTGRRAVLAPSVEHVGVLYSATTLRETLSWLDKSFGRAAPHHLAVQGGWIALLLVAVVALGWPLARLLPAQSPARQTYADLAPASAGPTAPAGQPEMPAAGQVVSGLRPRADPTLSAPPPALAGQPLDTRLFWLAALGPALIIPFALYPAKFQILPVLVADYLALHLGVYGLSVLAVLGRAGQLRGAFPARIWWIAACVALFGIVVFGGVIDRYVTSFFPDFSRLPIILALAPGAIAFLLADALLTRGGRAPLWQILVSRSAFLGSLLVAVMLDFDRLLFLVIILPVILLFFLLFGTMSGWVGRRTGLPAASGLGLGLILAWALGVTFPLFNHAS